MIFEVMHKDMRALTVTQDWIQDWVYISREQRKRWTVAVRNI